MPITSSATKSDDWQNEIVDMGYWTYIYSSPSLSMLSGHSQQRPPSLMWPQEYGHSRQVVFCDRFNALSMLNVYNNTCNMPKIGGPLRQVVSQDKFVWYKY